MAPASQGATGESPWRPEVRRGQGRGLLILMGKSGAYVLPDAGQSGVDVVSAEDPEGAILLIKGHCWGLPRLQD